MKISRYQQFKILVASLKDTYKFYIHFGLCWMLGCSFRYFIYTPFNYSLFSISNLGYLLFDLIYTVLIYYIGKHTAIFISEYFIYCMDFKSDFFRQNGHIIEWEDRNYHLEKKGILTKGDVLGIKLVEQLMIDKIYLPNMESVQEWMNDFPDETKYYVWQNSNVNHSYLFAISAMKRYLDTKAWYYIRKSKERLSCYREELIKVTWEPKRAFQWCENSLNEYLEDSDFD